MWSIEAANLFSVKGLVAVVTGGGSGIGLMMAKALEANGAKVYIIGRRLETLEAAAKQSQYGNIIPLQGDVTNKDDLAKIVEKIAAEDGFINVLIANSGITGPTFKRLKREVSISEFRNNLWATDPDDFTHTYKVNAAGVYFSVVAFLELLDAGNKKGNVEQKSQVIATSSVAAFSRVSLSSYSYGTSKAAVVDLMKKFATSLVPYSIRSNVIAPGLFPSEMADGLIESLTTSEKKIESSVIPLERAGSLEDMAGATLFLTSRAGAYLNGNVILNDGGRLGIIPSTY